MDPRSPLVAPLVASAAPWFAAERLVIDAYWDWSGRSARTDRVWLLRQVHKEISDGMVPRLSLAPGALAASSSGPVDGLSNLLREAAEELDHASAFLAVVEELPQCEGVDEIGDWPENEVLRACRAEHRRRHRSLGETATRFTEGGGATLYASGAQRRGRGPIDDAIARACEAVLGDEVAHMGDLGSEPEHAASSRELLASLVVEQCRQRVRMRAEQFSWPVSGTDLEALVRTGTRPDDDIWERFGLTASERRQ